MDVCCCSKRMSADYGVCSCAGPLGRWDNIGVDDDIAATPCLSSFITGQINSQHKYHQVVICHAVRLLLINYKKEITA